MPDDLILDHFYKGRWWTQDAYAVLRGTEMSASFGPLRIMNLPALKPGEGDPAKIKADRDAGIIPAETLRLMERE